MRQSGVLYLIICLLLTSSLSGCAPGDGNQPVPDTLRNYIIQTLNKNLRIQSEWTKVHAAEYLIDLGYQQNVKSVFLKEQERHGAESPYRIGIWRVLAQTADIGEEKKVWIDHILKVYGDTNATDRVHAAETLAKLHTSPAENYPEETREILEGPDNPLSVYTHWAVYSPIDTDTVEVGYRYFLDVILHNKDTALRSMAAYALRHLGQLNEEAWHQLASKALSEPEYSKARVYLTSAALVTAPDGSLESGPYLAIRKQLLSYKYSLNKNERVEMAVALAESGRETDMAELVPLLEGGKTDGLDEKKRLVAPDIKDGAGYAILRINRRIERTLTYVDWLVIIVYLLGMLGIGFYYYYKNKSQKDFFLGGGKMSSIAVGLSLFATFTSAVTYMAYPGEMIKHGPVVFIGIIAFPFAYYVVGWFIIPRLRKFNVISAYEILEIKLGKSVRLLATFMFLILRLLWMATIIYITVYIVILSIFKVDSRYALLLSISLMILTVIYTSIGGLKAVVVTDAIQSVILLGGALAAILVVCLHFGSFTSWLPAHWLPQWGEVNLKIDMHDRSSIGAAVLMTFLWWVASAGGDQMSVQRFLGTKDVRSARRSYGISLIATLIGMFLLALVGLALIAFFKDNSQYLPTGYSLFEHADKLFPKFIVVGLPTGVSGLLVAGVLAAAMSSLSSGLNSCTSIVVEDVIKQFKWNRWKSTDNLKNVQKISLLIGVITLALSLIIPYVSGNLYDLSIKVINLLASPLFVLFFLALFIPFATKNGTFIGGIASVIAAVAVAFFKVFGIDVFFVTIASFGVGAIIGIICSYIDYKILGSPIASAKIEK